MSHKNLSRKEIHKKYRTYDYNAISHLSTLGLSIDSLSGGFQPSKDFLGAHVSKNKKNYTLHIDLVNKAQFISPERFLKAIQRTEKNLKSKLFG